MPRERVAEHHLTGRPAGDLRVRVDLHGVSVFGPGEDRTLIRWEWIRGIEAGPGGVVVSSAEAELTLPLGAFGLAPTDLARRLEQARSITTRPEVIGALAQP